MGGFPRLWAQAGGADDSAGMAYLALRRWLGGLTLGPSRPAADWSILAALAVAILLLLAMAAAFQGPSAALRQFADPVGHARLFREAVARILRSGGMVVTLLALTVLSWTAAQSVGYLRDDPERTRADLILLTAGRGPIGLAAEHAAPAAASPLRDVAGLGDNLPLLAAALAALIWRTPRASRSIGPPARKTVVVAVGAALYLLYRLVGWLIRPPVLSPSFGVAAEVAFIPALMLIADGFLLAWVLAELRDGEPDDDRADRADPSRALRLMPAACLACLAALPARYATTALLLAARRLPPTALAGTDFAELSRWLLGPGSATVQAASLAFLGVAGAAAWSGGSLGEAAWGFRRLLRREGGRLAAVTILAASGCAAVSTLPYAAMSALPPAGWVLPAADAYAHYATLPIGLWTLAAGIELAGRGLPRARLAAANPDAPPDV